MLARGVSDVFVRMLCLNFPVEPWSIRANAGDEMATDTGAASEPNPERNVKDRMPDLIRWWITGGRKQILLSFNCFLFRQQVIVSSSDVHVLFYSRARQQLTLALSLIISLNCGHKHKLSTLRVQQRTPLGNSFFLLLLFQHWWRPTGRNGQNPNWETVQCLTHSQPSEM